MLKTNMPRPKKHRTTNCYPAATYYKPSGIPMYNLKDEVLEKDELESIQLADLDGLTHEEAAEKMKVSRATFGRILKSARGKIADCIINGKAIKIN